MEEKYLLALDAGTGSVRAVLFDLLGNEVKCAQREWEHKEDKRFPGSMDFDWDYNWGLATECIREVVLGSGISPSSIAAISTTCMREGIVLYDGAGKEIWACANVDSRSGDEVLELINFNPQLEKELYKISGQTYALGALPRLLWVKNKLPEVYKSTAKLGMFNDWLIYKLSGEMYVEPSNGSTTGLFDLKSRSWDVSIARRCGLRTDIFPEVRECGSLAGKLSAEAARDTLLYPGTPVVVGGGDAQLGCVGVGVVAPNEAAVFGGSFWQYEYNTGEAITDNDCRVRVNCHAVPGVWQFEALAFKPGLVMRWFRDGFCQREKERAAAEGVDPYQLMDREAAKVPAGCYGMLCTFSDVMNYISWKHASPTFTNFELDPEKFNRYTFYRSILENTALLVKGHLQLVYESVGKKPESVVFAGGAAKSPLWCQIVADTLGLPVKVPVVKEATALGAAIMAGYGAGLYESIEKAARELVKWDKTYLPNSENHKIYSEAFGVWREVYKEQLRLSDMGATRYMWSAPGV